VQGAGGCDILDGTYAAINTIAQTLAKNGVTAFLTTTVYSKGGQAPFYAVTEAARRGTAGAAVLGLHLEGPFVNPVRCGMIKKENITSYSAGVYERILKACGGSLRMMTVAPELKGALGLIKRLKKDRVVVSIGHTDATYEQALEGFDAGITHATHIFNAMSGLHHRQPGAVGAVLTDERISAQLIADGRHLHPAVAKIVVKQKDPDKVALITDSMSAAGLPDGKYVYNGLRYESKKGLAVYCGTDTLIGTTLTLNKMIKRIVDMGIVDLKDAVRMASLTPAEVLGIDNKKGSLEAGKDADIVVMDKDCNVKMTIIRGEVIK
jgi:N-acetylglucosamine-6-phosphate deacetylase